MMAIQQGRILVVGDIMLDRYWFGEVNRISPEAPVPVVRVQSSDERLGGAANVARNIAALSAQAALMGVVGDDEPGKKIAQLLQSEGIKPFLQTDPNVATTVKLRVIGRTQQLLRVDFEQIPSQDVLQTKLNDFIQWVKNFDVVIFSDYGKGGLQHIPAMITAAREAGKWVLIDPKGSDWERYRGAHLITPNRGELKEVVGGWNSEDQLTAKAQQVREHLELDALLVTRSEQGMSLYQPGQVMHVPTVAREVFDVSGAGDTVIATLACGLAAGQSLQASVQLANRAAGIVVGKLGTATVTYQELFAS
jgi:rfaE bifunctional protein kinase chain/domain